MGCLNRPNKVFQYRHAVNKIYTKNPKIHAHCVLNKMRLLCAPLRSIYNQGRIQDFLKGVLTPSGGGGGRVSQPIIWPNIS